MLDKRFVLSTLAIIGLSLSIAWCQGLLDSQKEQVTFFTSTLEPEVTELDDGTWQMVTRGDLTATGRGVYLTPEVESNFIEYQKWLVNNGEWQWPPATIKMGDAPGVYSYLLKGEVGDRFRVRIDTNDVPIYDLVVIEGTGPIDPPPPPIGDFKQLTDLSKAAADVLNDPPTRAALKTELAMILDLGSNVSLDVATQRIVSSIRFVMSGRQGESLNRDWHGQWRTPVSNKIAELAPTTTAQYYAMMRAVVEGL